MKELERKKGKVYIVGAGPGDPGLVTVKGIRCIEEAEVIVFDHLVNEELLSFARPDVRLIYAGKQGGDHTLVQDEINRILVEEASLGSVVTRLKGGDPLIFGRGGEEALVLKEAGLPFEIVPGVSSAIAVPAYAGISLTQRGYASTLAFVTGHEDPSKDQSAIDWQALAGMGTLVFLMGVKNLAQIADNLIRHGKPAHTPAALIRWGTTPRQQTLTAPLGDLARQAEAARFSPPAILVVGEVVALRERLNWFETKPLFGKGVVITRPEAQAESFAALLGELGARVIHFPTIRIVPPASWEGCDAALAGLGNYDWAIFTSANGVRFFFQRLRETGRDIRDLKGVRLAAIGPATASALEGMGLRVDLVPETYLSEGVVQAFSAKDIRGARILLPRAQEARDVIPEGLAAQGARVDVATVYRTVGSGRKAEEMIAYLDKGLVDVITFTSPSTVASFREIMGQGFTLPSGIRVAAIGPITAAAVRREGFPLHVLQETYTIPGLTAALAACFRSPSPL